MIEFELQPDQRDFILRHASLSEQLKRRLSMGIHGASGLLYRLSPEEFDQLVDTVAAEANHAKTQKLEAKFDAIYGQLAAVGRAYYNEFHDMPEDEPKRSSVLPPHLQEVVRSIIDDPRLTDLDQVNAALEAVMSAHNRTPVAEFAGLSPEQVFRLTQADWEDPNAAFHIREGLSFDDVGDTETVFNARIVLDALGADGTPATKGGSLNTKFVAEVVDAMRWPSIEVTRSYHKRRREEDFRPLEDLRYLLTYAGLMRKYAGRFKRTKLGTRLLDESRAGELYVLLLRTMYQEFDIGHPTYPDEFFRLQWALPFAVYVLGRFAEDWISTERIGPRCLLYTVVPFVDETHRLFSPAYIGQRYFLEPLTQFGLVEDRNPKYRFSFGQEVRITPLFDRVFQLKI